jgi:hypothetical protein
MKHDIPATVELCPVREPCWRDLNARGIERGASPERRICCGFETAGTILICPRKRRYVHPDVAVEQLTMQLS